MRLSSRLVASLAMILVALSSWLPVPTTTGEAPLASGVELPCGDGKLEDREGLRVLRLCGTPYDMGYQHGVLLAREIRSGLREQIYEGLIRDEGVPHLLLLGYARHVDTHLPSDYRQEMRGLADGAGVSYSDVLIMHSFEDFLAQPSPARLARDLLLSFSPLYVPGFALANGPSLSGLSSDSGLSGGGVSVSLDEAFAAFGQATEDGKLLHGASFSSAHLGIEDLVLIVREAEVGNRFVTLGPPGAIGATMGLNEEKISVAELASPSLDGSADGIPLSFILRDVLQYAGDISTALRLLASSDRASGHNVIIGDGKPADAKAMELSAHLYAVFPAEDGFVGRGNQYFGPALLETQRISWQVEDSAGRDRLEALRAGLDAGGGRLDLLGAADLLRDSHAAVGGTEGGLLGVVIASSDLEVCLCPADTGQPACFRLNEEPQASPAWTTGPSR